MQTVGIIGAGAAGLCALRWSLATRKLTPLIWEHSSKIGGTWSFNPKVGKDEHGFPIHSSMYNNLRTNLPKEVMGFSDFPFRKGGKSFIHHSEVLKYLDEYADNFELKPWIQFEHNVSNVKRIKKENGKSIWEVSVTDLQSGDSKTAFCDAILVCNGHYTTPKIPYIPEIDGYSGAVSHSHDYRNSEIFRNKNVILLGAGFSGLDISLEVAKVANHVYLSHNFPDPVPSVLPSNMTQVKGIREATTNGFKLHDGSDVIADSLMLCTGYEYNFPFLSESCGIKVENNHVKMLHKHIINTAHTTMGFLGVSFRIIPFLVFDLQVQYFLDVMCGRLQLPSEQEMNRQIELEVKKINFQGTKLTDFHLFEEKQWLYYTELGNEINFKNSQLEAIQHLYDIVTERRELSVSHYKQFDYEFTFHPNGSFELEESCDGLKVNTAKAIDVLKFIQLSKQRMEN